MSSQIQAKLLVLRKAMNHPSQESERLHRSRGDAYPREIAAETFRSDIACLGAGLQASLPGTL
jgi:hypothetical protein